jgi:predicted nucleic acid-binding protein
VTLVDTGPLVALINRNDPHHAACVAVAITLPAEPLVTTWPCFTEAMYLVHRVGGLSSPSRSVAVT